MDKFNLRSFLPTLKFPSDLRSYAEENLVLCLNPIQRES